MIVSEAKVGVILSIVGSDGNTDIHRLELCIDDSGTDGHRITQNGYQVGLDLDYVEVKPFIPEDNIECRSTHGGAGFGIDDVALRNKPGYFICGVCGETLPIPENWRNRKTIYSSWLHQLFNIGGRSVDTDGWHLPAWMAYV